MSDQSLETKQKYLRQKILDTGHDAQAFMVYCEQKYGSIDLQGWKLSKLKEIVNGFLGEKSEKTFTLQQLDEGYGEQVREYQEEEEMQQGQTEAKVEAKKQLVFSQADWQIFGLGPPPAKKQSPVKDPIKLTPPVIAASGSYTNFTSLSNSLSMSPPSVPTPVQTPKSQPNLSSLSSPKNALPSPKWPQIQQKKSSNKEQQQKLDDTLTNINKIIELGTIQMNVKQSKVISTLPNISDIRILKTQQKSRNFLQGDYTVYTIQFLPCGVVVQKKFNQFRKLRMILQKIYPHVRLPYLQPQGWLVHTSSQGNNPQTLNKYKYQIVQFLKYITMRNQLLKHTKLVHIFCNFLAQQPDITKYNYIQKPKYLSQLTLPQGKLKFSKYETIHPIDKYITNTQSLLTQIDTCYQKLRKTMDTLFYNYQLVGKSLQEVGGVFEILEGLIQKFNFQNDCKKDLRVYEGLREVCERMKESVDGQAAMFRNQMYGLFKYERDNMTTIKETGYQPRPKMYAQLSKQSLHVKKSSQLFPKSQPNLLIQSIVPIQDINKGNRPQLLIQNMFWAYSTLKNIQDYWIQLRFKINQKLTTIAYQQLDKENSQLNFWNTVIKKCVI